MTTSRVTPPAEEEEADVDGVEDTGGVTVSVCDRFGQGWASLRLMVTASMAHIMEKCKDSG